jgi:hypothetical protein
MVTVCLSHQEGIRGITLVGFPLDDPVKVNPEESASMVFTLAGCATEALSEVGKRKHPR